MDRQYTDCLDEHIKLAIAQNLRIEAEWLNSISAPVKQLPDTVAGAVFMRWLFERMPSIAARHLVKEVSTMAACQNE